MAIEIIVARVLAGEPPLQVAQDFPDCQGRPPDLSGLERLQRGPDRGRLRQLERAFADCLNRGLPPPPAQVKSWRNALRELLS